MNLKVLLTTLSTFSEHHPDL